MLRVSNDESVQNCNTGRQWQWLSAEDQAGRRAAREEQTLPASAHHYL
jgi:hypothetical protein